MFQQIKYITIEPYMIEQTRNIKYFPKHVTRIYIFRLHTIRQLISLNCGYILFGFTVSYPMVRTLEIQFCEIKYNTALSYFQQNAKISESTYERTWRISQRSKYLEPVHEDANGKHVSDCRICVHLYYILIKQVECYVIMNTVP